MTGNVLLEDLEIVSKSSLPFEKYKNCSFLVTGATGLIGSLLIKTLLYCNERHHLNLKVIGVVRSIQKAKEIYGEILANPALKFMVQDLQDALIIQNEHVDYIVHAAAMTSSKDMVNYPVNNIKTSLNGTLSMLEFAVAQTVKGMVYISSMEVYGSMNVEDHLVEEDELGYVDLGSVRSCYPEGKRLCECLCNAYAKQYGLKVVSARLAQTFGAGILKTENRVFAQFARSAMNGEDIILHTRGLSEGNYVYSRDAIKGILLLLTEGIPGNAYNVSNERSHSTIGNMAEMVAEHIAGGKIRVVYDIPEDIASMGYAPDVKMHLSSAKLQRLGWAPEVDLQEAYQRMIRFMKGE